MNSSPSGRLDEDAAETSLRPQQLSEHVSQQQAPKAYSPLGRNTAKWMAIFAGAGPAVFALLFCLNSAIAILFFDSRVDRPTREYVVMLTAGQVFLFIWAYVVSFLAFASLALWLLLISRTRMNRFFATAIFVPVMTFISCKMYGQYFPVDFVEPPPPLVFGAALLLKFPLRGFLLILVFNLLSVAFCCWFLPRSRGYKPLVHAMSGHKA